MSKLFLIFSHKLTAEQITDAQNNFNVSEFVYLPNDLQQIWSNISPFKDDITTDIQLIYEFVIQNDDSEQKNKKNYILIQGDFGATYYLVDKFINTNIIPIYATTERTIIEEKTNENETKKTVIFKHVKFREYK